MRRGQQGRFRPQPQPMRNQLHSSILVALVASTSYGVPCSAQQLASTNERVVLESRAARAESAAKSDIERSGVKAERLAEASALRTRLRDGDFHAGDRVTLWVNGETAMSNTFTVRTGNYLEIPTLPQIPLRGVLRSELRDRLYQEISRYIKQPEIHVTTLVNVAVLGAIGKPGFYTVAPDAPITDVLMTAGGPTGNADFGRSRIVREGVDFAAAKVVRQYFDVNSTLDDIGIQSGDQIVIGERPHRWQSVSAVLGAFALVIPAAVVLLRH
jgi:protein involved in polysaccharide export with SLBB domain